MAQTYTQIYIQIVFAVRGRRNLIPKKHKSEIFQYIAGIIRNRGHKLIRINGMSDHVHILIGLKPTLSISDLVRDIKSNSSKFINEKQWIREKFAWQEGFGAFSYGHSQLDRVVRYIENQETHHFKRSFQAEYLKFLKRFHVEFDDKYLFD